MSRSDVCIVGAGAGGAVAAWALVQRGVRVLLLETGPRYDPASYATHSPDHELTGSPFLAVTNEDERESYRSAPGGTLDPGYAHLGSRSHTTFARPASKERQPFRWMRALGVGGSTLHFAGEAHRFPPHAFRMRSERGVAEDWPVDYEELEPYYARMEDRIGVAGEPGNPFKAPRGPFPLPAHPLSAASLHVREGARRLGWQLQPNTLAVLSRPRAGRAACHYCNGCWYGCMVRAKGSVDVSVIPEAERSGRLELRTGFHVSRLEHAADGRITGVLGRDADGREERIRARAVVLAAGAIETPRILLNSAGGAHPDGVGNAHGQVGRYLMDTLYVSVSALFDPGIESYAGHPEDSRIWDANGSASPGPVPNGMILGPSAGVYAGPRGTAWEAVPGFGVAHREEMARRFGGAVEIFGQVEQLPRPENRVTLDERTDRFGVPLARVEMHLDGTDLEALSELHRRARALADASGAREILGQWTAYDVPACTHPAGTCRMGVRRERSVLDAFGAVHGHPNLVVADASAFVTQGAGDSPSLTIQALALRAAGALAERAERGAI